MERYKDILSGSFVVIMTLTASKYGPQSGEFNILSYASSSAQTQSLQKAPWTESPKISNSWGEEKSYAKQVSDPELRKFVSELKDGTDFVRGIYVKGLFEYKVEQQPPNNSAFITNDVNEVSQYRLVTTNNSMGVVAHYELAGEKLTEIPIGGQLVLIYGNGKISAYTMSQNYRFRALDPQNTYSDFVQVNSSLSDMGFSPVSSTDVIKGMYSQKNSVVLQTCIEHNGDPSWGRWFGIAEKVK